MIDFEKELATILEDDPLGLLNVKPKSSGKITADERLIASFEEINAFVRENGREPAESRDISERKLYSRLKGLRDNPKKSAALADYDTYKLLPEITIPEPKEINSIDDILEDDALGLLDDVGFTGSDPNGIFKLKHVTPAKDTPDYVAKRRPCAEFEQFEPLFKQTHAELAAKKKVTIPFNSERQIEVGEFFILQGLLVYVANKGDWEQKKDRKVDARLYVIFENGTESNMLLRSLAASLWKDTNSRQIVDALQYEIFEKSAHVLKDDEATGTIYILQSLSNDPQIKGIENLYKIGFSSQSVWNRIHNAPKEPTYLMGDVAVVTEFNTYNLNPQKLEHLIHRFFAEACLDIDLYDNEGKRYTPREWFVVPLHVIETAVNLLISGEIVNYRYDSQKQTIVNK